MDKLTSKITSQLDALYGLYQMALDYTVKIKPEKENELSKWMDTRQRILGKTDVVSKSAAVLIKQFDQQNNIPAGERALVAEKKNMLKDIITNLSKKEYELLNKMHYRMGGIRTELADMTRKKNASTAYAQAPRPKLMVA